MKNTLFLSITLGVLAVLLMNGYALGSTNISSPVWSDTLGHYDVLVACSDNGSFVVAGSDTGILRLYNNTGKTIWTYVTNGTAFTSVSISGDGRTITATTGKDLFVFDHSGNLLFDHHTNSTVIRAAVSRNGDTVIFSEGGGITMFSREGDHLGNTIRPGTIWDVAISGEGTYGAAAIDLGWPVREGDIAIIERNGSAVQNYPTTNQGIAVGITDDGSIIVGIDDYTLYSIFRNGTTRWNFSSNPPFWDVVITSDGRYIAAGSQYYLRIFNETGSLLWQNQEDGYVYSVAFSENGDYIIAGSSDMIRLFDKSGNMIWQYGSGARHVVASNKGGCFVVGTDKEVKYFSKWGKTVGSSISDSLKKSNYVNNTSPETMTSAPRPAPLPDLIAMGALFYIGLFRRFLYHRSYTQRTASFHNHNLSKADPALPWPRIPFPGTRNKTVIRKCRIVIGK